MFDVTVVIPIYKTELSGQERLSLESICRELASRRIVAVHPRGLDVTPLLPARVETLDFDPQFFQGIRGYNRLMTSTTFYDAFADSRYILIAQLDAYIFRDDLDVWLSRGYDYVGAPWLRRPLNRVWPVTWIKKVSERLHHGLYSKLSLYDRVGNGGLSLRRVSSHRRVCADHARELARLNAQGKKGFPEDVFFATRVPEFKYPTAQQALAFSFDKYPRYCMRLAHGHLPMGCHAWFSRKMRRFWSKYIK